MNWKSPGLWIGVLSLCAVLLMGIVDMQRTSPGELATVHQRDPDLAAKNSCSECHGGWLSSMTSACLECHELIGTHVEEGRGLHGVLEDGLAQRCAACHSEHHGPGFMIVNDQSFRAAGVPDVEEFDHGMIGFAMDGEHLELDCTECHEYAETQQLPEGANRFLGLDRDCATCHEDPHEGAMVVDCASCHGQTAFDDLFSLGHEEFLPLVGGHGEASCRDCHGEGDAHSLEVVGAAGPRPDARDCLACHDSPHAPEFQAGAARLAALPTGAGCVACHAAEHTAFDDPALELTADQHATSGFPLDLPHDDVDCDTCHDPELGEYTERFPGRTLEACSVCHADPHEGQFDTGSFARQECTACHANEHFEPHAFTVDDHARTEFALELSHAEVECSECHAQEHEDAARTFNGTPSACDACHADAHEGFFDEECAQLDPIDHGDCARCHDTGKFSEVPEESFDHALWTGFPATGAHAQEACEACHERTAEPDELDRRFGRVAEIFGEYEGCATCHTDPHGGQFDTPELIEDAFGDTGCIRCHVEVSFRAFPREFDHGHWTGFALDGAHSDVSCASCHTPLPRPTEDGRTWARAPGGTCADCHTDPHAGQFEQAGATDCSTCHRSTGVFRDLSFNHEWDARFRLGEAHADLSCGACHLPTSIDGIEAVRYRPLPRECVDCHGLREGALLRRKGKRK